MENNDIYDYNSTAPSPNVDTYFDILNNVPIYYINNTYDFSWNIIEITNINIILPY